MVVWFIKFEEVVLFFGIEKEIVLFLKFMFFRFVVVLVVFRIFELFLGLFYRFFKG